MGTRPKVALYWASSCGGCEVAVANLHEGLLGLAEAVELWFCPCLLDTKRVDVEALGDGELFLTLFDGSIRTDENVEMAHLLRRKSKLLVAFGACAQGGGIPALSNLSSREEHMAAIYGGDERPCEEVAVPEGLLRLPRFHERVRCLAEVVEVDYAVPGCPPESKQVAAALAVLAGSAPLPPRGTVLGAGDSSVCAECARTREEKHLTALRRVFEFEADRRECLLDQGLACLGLATRSGCGALCPAVNMPCTGCYGAPEGVYDPPSRFLGALASCLDVSPHTQSRDPAQIADSVDQVLDGLPDPAGTAGKYTLAARRGLRSRESRR